MDILQASIKGGSQPCISIVISNIIKEMIVVPCNPILCPGPPQNGTYFDDYTPANCRGAGLNAMKLYAIFGGAAALGACGLEINLTEKPSVKTAFFL